MAYPDRRNPVYEPPPSEKYEEVSRAFELTRDEIRVLKECNNESFWRRCVPFMTFTGFGAYYAVHLGYLKPNPKLGAIPKVSLALILAYTAGKISYQKECEKKIMLLPGGRLKESIMMKNRGKDGAYTNPYGDTSFYTDAAMGASRRSEEGASIAELNTDRPMESFDDFRIPDSFGQEVNDNMPASAAAREVSYDDLRRQNRDMYESRRPQYRSGPLDDYKYANEPMYPVSPSNNSNEDNVPVPLSNTPPRVISQRKNLYGDVWEK